MPKTKPLDALVALHSRLTDAEQDSLRETQRRDSAARSPDESARDQVARDFQYHRHDRAACLANPCRAPAQV